jgi:hypothetical protein
MHPLDRPYFTYLHTALLAAAVLLLFLFVNSIRRRELTQMRIFLLAVTAISATASLMFMPGIFFNTSTGIVGLSLMDYLPVRMFIEPHSEGRLLVRAMIALFFLTTFILLIRTKKPQAGLMAGILLVFLAVNLADVALHTYHFFTYKPPQIPVQRIEIRVNPEGDIFEHVITPRSLWWRYSLFPLVWSAICMIAQLKIRHETKRAARRPAAEQV